MIPATTLSPELLARQVAVEQLLYDEARLLDEGRFEAWLSLYTPDCLYWIPCNADDIDPALHVCIAYYDYSTLQERLWRIRSGLNYGQDPPSRTTHLVSNVICQEVQMDALRVASRFVAVELRRGIQEVFSGSYEHELVPQEDGWKIKTKKVILLNNDEPMGNLSFIL